MTFTIRGAARSDAGRISELCIQLGYDVSYEDINFRILTLLEKPLNAVFVADQDGFVVGWIQVEVRHVLESGEFAEISGLVVDREYRRRGIAARLVSRAEEWARESGQKRIRVRTNVTRVESHPFYRKLEYEETKKQAVYEKGL